MTSVITIPQELIKEKELVLVPRKKYEELLQFREMIPEIKLTLGERKALRGARKELREGRYLTIKQLQHELGC